MFLRSSTTKMVLEKGLLKICSQFTGEHPRRSVISIKLLCSFIEIVLWWRCSPTNLWILSRTLPDSSKQYLSEQINVEYLLLWHFNIFLTSLYIIKNTWFTYTLHWNYFDLSERSFFSPSISPQLDIISIAHKKVVNMLGWRYLAFSR